MRTALVDDPEYPSRRRVGFAPHNLGYQAVEGLDAIGLLQASQNFGAMNVVRSKIGPCATALVFMLDTLTSPVSDDLWIVEPEPRLDARLLVGRDDKLVAAQRPSLPAALVKVENQRRAFEEQRIAGPDP